MGTIATMNVKLAMDSADYERGIQHVQQQSESLAKRMGGLGQTMSLAVTAPLVGIGAMAINSAADFEQSMNVMAQVSGATTEQMAALQAQALNLGAVTSFSAGEAAAAQLELAKAGLDANEVMAATPGVLDLAAAGGLGLAQAAEIAANAVNTFGLDASSTTNVANMLAAAANASSVEVTDLADGMKMAGAVFSSAGQSIDDLNIAMALLGNNGIKGSDAGTSLKTALMRLTAPTDEAAAVLHNLGVQVYDTQGNMREFPVIMADLQQAMYGTNQVTVTSSNLTQEQAARMEYLRKTIESTQTKLANYASGIAGIGQSGEDSAAAQNKLQQTLAAAQAEYDKLASVGSTTSTVMKTLTEEERQQALATIFGADAIRSISVLMAEGTDGWNEMAGALGVAGAATDVANARMSGMKGAFEYLKGSIDSFLIGAALPFLDSIGQIIRSVADAITWVGELPEPVRNVTLGIAAAAAAAGPLLLIISKLLPVFGMMGTALGAIVSPVGLLVVGVAALGVAWAANFGGIRDVTDGVISSLGDLWTAVQWIWAGDAADVDWWWDIVEAWGLTGDAAMNTGRALYSFGVSLGSVLTGLKALGSYLLEAGANGRFINQWLNRLPGAIRPAVATIGQVAAALRTLIMTGDVGGFVATLQNINWGNALAAVQQSIAELRGRIGAILQGIDWGGALASVGESLGALASGIADKLKKIDWGGALSAAGDWLGGLTVSVVTAITALDWGGALTTTAGWLGGLTDGIIGAIASIDWGAALTAAGDWLVELTAGIISAIQSVDWGALLTQAGDWLASLTGAVIAAVTSIDWGGLLAAAGDWLSGLSSGVVTAITSIDWGGALTAAGDAFGGLETAVADGLRGLGFEGAATALDNLKAAVGGLQASWTAAWPAMQSAAGTAWGVIAPAFVSAWTWLQMALPVALNTLRSLWATAWPAIQSAVTTAWDAIAPAFSAAWMWLQTTLPAALSGLQTVWAAAWPVLQSAATSAWAAIAPALASAWAWLQVTLPAAVAALQTVWGTAWPVIQTAVTTAWGAIQPAFSAAWTWLQVNLPIAVGALQVVWGAAWGVIRGAVTTAWDAIQPAITALQGALAGLPASVGGASAQFGAFWAQVTAIGATLAAFFAPAVERVQAAFAALPDSLAPLMPKLGELGAAFGGLLQAIQPILLVIGAGLAVAASFGINMFASALGTLPTIAGTIIDQVTATINLISTVLTETVTAVKAIIDGDWTTVWESAKTIAGGFNTFFRGLFSRLGTFMGAVARNISEPIINTLKDLGIDITPHLEAVRKFFEDIWGKVVGYIQPVIDIVEKVQDAIAGFQEWLGTVTLPNPFQPLVDTWNSVASHLPGGSGGETKEADGARAIGGPVMAGGRYLVGERGPEMFVPSRSGSIIPNNELSSIWDNLVGSGAAEGATVTIETVNVSNEIDVHALAYRVAQLLVT